MRPLFPRHSHTLFRVGLCALLSSPVVAVAAALAWARAPFATGQREASEQPLQVDHRHHVRDDAIPCSYCHAGAPVSPTVGRWSRGSTCAHPTWWWPSTTTSSARARCICATRDFADRRRVRATADAMNRLYVAEAAPTVTGALADHRLRVARAHVHSLAAALRAVLSPAAAPVARGDPSHRRWIDAVTADLRAQAGAALVTAGDRQPPAAHAETVR